MSPKELKQIIKLATSRRSTLIQRLQLAQAKRNDIKCDEIRSRLQMENELISNAIRSLQVAA